MRFRRLTVAVTALAVMITATAAVAGPAAATGSDARRAGGSKRVGYYTQWSNYSGFFVRNLDTNGQAARLTHINYAFGNVNADGRCFIVNAPGVGDAWADYQRGYPAQESVDGVADAAGQPLAGNFNQLRKLKAKYPHLKVMISLGGWTWSKYFSDAALTPRSRRAFVASCIDLYLRGNLPAADGRGGPGTGRGVFDGIDLDWEWPGSEGNPGNVIRAEDKQNFTALLAEFRAQLDAYGKRARRHYELTAFLPANPLNMDAGYEGRRIFRHLDFATVQGYDFHGAWEMVTNQQSALRVPAGAPGATDFSLTSVVDNWRSRGAPGRKIVVGIPYYGRGWTGITSSAGNGLFQTATAAAPGIAPGHENYSTLVGLIGTNGFRLHRDRAAGHAWLFDGSTFWTIDDPVVIRQKMAYVRRAGLGGAMMWSLDADTADAELTRAIHRGLAGR